MNDALLRELEEIATTAFSQKNPMEASNASLKLTNFAKAGNLIPNCKFILSKSNNPYCLFFAFTILCNSFTSGFNSIPQQERKDMRLLSQKSLVALEFQLIFFVLLDFLSYFFLFLS